MKKQVCIYSIEQLERYTSEIIGLCEMFKARAGINLNPRNNRDVALDCLERLVRDIRCNNFDVSKTYNSVCGENKGSDKHWIIDLDEHDLPMQGSIMSFLDTIESFGEKKIIAQVPSKTGMHLITKSFNRQKFKEQFPTIEIHVNNPTNLYIP